MEVHFPIVVVYHNTFLQYCFLSKHICQLHIEEGRLCFCMKCSRQEEPWAVTQRSTGHAVGRRCKLCATTVITAYADLTWEAAVLKAKVDPLFMAELKGARNVAAGAEKSFAPQLLHLLKEVVATTEKWYWFVTAEEFAKEYAIPLSEVPELQPLVHSRCDEMGKQVSGILVPHRDQPWRLVRLMSSENVSVESTLMDASQHLREDQGSHLQSHLVKERSLPQLKKTGFSPAEIGEFVEAAKSKRKRVEALLPEPVTQPPEEAAPLAADPAESEDAQVSHVQSPLLASALVATQKGKSGKGQSRGRGGRGKRPNSIATSSCHKFAKQAKVLNAVSKTEVSDLPEAAETASKARSRSPRGCKSVAPSTKGLSMQDRAHECISETLSLAVVLGGCKKYKANLYNAQRLLSQLEGEAQYEPDAVALRAHISMVQIAQQINVKSLPGLTREQRDNGLTQVCPNMREPDYPDSWKAALFCVYVRDMPIDNLQDWISVVSPFAPGSCKCSGMPSPRTNQSTFSP